MASNPAGTLQTVMEKQGIECRVVRTAYEDISNFNALEPDVLLVLGGSPGVYQADEYPFLKHELRIIEQRLAADKPYFGICLGTQLMAAALGAKVYKGSAGPEIGWFDLAVTDEANGTGLEVFNGQKIMQWHGDTFDFPQGAKLLGSSEKYQNQVIGYGRNAIGFQGHIEVTAPILADWYVQDAGVFTKHPELHKTLKTDTAAHLQGMTKATEIFMTEWLARVLPR
jgi:GMP synthase (glutamine-hydrolysing)